MKNKVVYRHLKPCGEVFYIGYGSKARAHSKHGRNKHWNNLVNKYGLEVQILCYNLSKVEAKELEIILIDWYGRKDLKTGLLCNKTKGGDGGNGLKYHSKETKEKMSLAQKGRKATEETRKKLSESHKGIKHSKESLLKRSLSHMETPKYRGKCKYKGVCFCKKRNKFRATIYLNNKNVHLGYFENEIDAHYKYEEMLEIKKQQLFNEINN